MILPATSYQGGKGRIASDVADYINPDFSKHFYDTCCGSGAISIELINRGFPLDQIHMIDRGPWGLFWEAIGNGTFDINRFKTICDQIPSDPRQIQPYVKELSAQSSDIDTIYVYLILQAASFGSKAIWIKKNKWQNCSFRRYWEPTATSNRRSHVNPMMPMPNTLFERVSVIVQKMKGIKGYHVRAENVEYRDHCIVYVDPDYQGTTSYGHSLNAVSFCNDLKEKYSNIECYVSEGCPLTDNAEMICGHRKKGGISGERKSKNEEWISRF